MRIPFEINLIKCKNFEGNFSNLFKLRKLSLFTYLSYQMRKCCSFHICKIFKSYFDHRSIAPIPPAPRPAPGPLF